MKRVSLYIPCFNAEKHIEKCIKSVLSQTYPVDEILIIDDGCTDKTIEKASKYNIKILRNKENKGLAFSRNNGILKAKNELVASVDADVVLDKKWLENIIKTFRNDKIAGACGNLEEYYKDRAANLWRLTHMKQNWGKKRAINPKFLFGSNCVFRKSAVKNIGLYNIKYRTNYEDVDVSNRLKSKGYKLIYEPKAKASHLKQDSITSVLKGSWNWTLFSYAPPNSLWNVFLRSFTDAYKGLTYLVEDIICFRIKIIPLDLLVFPSHIIFNLRYLKAKIFKTEYAN